MFKVYFEQEKKKGKEKEEGKPERPKERRIEKKVVRQKQNKLPRERRIYSQKQVAKEVAAKKRAEKSLTVQCKGRISATKTSAVKRS